MWDIPKLNTSDIGLALNWTNSAFYIMAVIDGILIAIGLQGNLSVITRRHILTKTDDPLIRSTAFADLLMVIIRIIPVFVTSLYRRWILGEMVCAITAYAQFIPNIVELLLMTALPLQRLYVMKCPLSSLTNASKRRKLGIWLSFGLWTSVTAAVVFLGIWNGKSGIYFALLRLSCQPLWLRSSSSGQGKVVRPLMLILFQMAPLVLTSVANIWVLVICSRSHNPVKRGSQLKTKSVVTILMVTSLFIISVLPGTLLMIILVFGGHDVIPPQYNYIPTISLHLSFVNVVSNYYIYKYSNRKKEAQQRVAYPRSRSDRPTQHTPSHPIQTSASNGINRYKISNQVTNRSPSREKSVEN